MSVCVSALRLKVLCTVNATHSTLRPGLFGFSVSWPQTSASP